MSTSTTEDSAGREATAENAPRWGLLVFWGFVALCGIINFVLPQIADWWEFSDFETQVMCLVIAAGVACGQMCFAVLISGLSGRTWTGSFLLGLGMSVFGVLCLAWGLNMAEGTSVDSWAVASVMPALLLAASLPLFGLRNYFGWRLVRGNQKRQPSVPLGIEDLFCAIAITAATIVLLRAPTVILESESDDFWIAMAITCTSLFIIGLIVMPLTARLAFAAKRRGLALCGLILFAFAIFGAAFATFQLNYPVGASWSQRMEIVPYLAALIGGAVGMYYLSLLMLRSIGMNLIRGKSGCQVSLSPAQFQIVAQQAKRRTRWRIGIILAVTTIVSIATSKVEFQRNRLDKMNERLSRIAESRDGHINISDHEIVALELRAEGRDEDLDSFRDCTQLTGLTLSSPQMSNGCLERMRYFPLLESLTIEEAAIHDPSLLHLSQLQHLLWLELKNTPVTGSGLNHISDTTRLTYLHMDDSLVDDTGCQALSRFTKLNNLSLRNTRVTDKGLSVVMANQALTILDVSGNAIDGSGLRELIHLCKLTLDDTQLNDEGLRGIGSPVSLEHLSLAGTLVTNAAGKHISRITKLRKLNLRRTAFTDDGLDSLQTLTSLRSVDLSETKITGAGFRNWNMPKLSYLRLIKSSVNDEGVKQLIKFAPMNHLSLAGTGVSDACLDSLAKMEIKTLDVSDTRISAKGLANTLLALVSELKFAEGQFSDAELDRIERIQNARIEIVTPEDESEATDDIQ